VGRRQLNVASQFHEQPVARRMGLFAGENYPVTEKLSRQGLYLPSGPQLTEEQLDHVADAVERYCRDLSI